MCGRYALTGTADEIAELMGLAGLAIFPPRYNIAPTQPVLMVAAGFPRPPGSNMPDRQAVLVRWGLIPAWVKDLRAFPLLINARSEGVAEKASFRAAMRHRRTLVPASGFYEWRQAADGAGGGRGRQAYWIRPRHGGVIAFAGLMETYAEPGGSEIDTGAIITTAANADIAHIHDRMPVVIQPGDFARWLDCRTREPRDVMDLLRPAQPDFFEAIPVSDLVNKVANTGPDIQERFLGETAPPPVKSRRPKAEADEGGQMTLF